MELNARMGGGLPLSIAAGADWPKWILQLCNGQIPNTETSITDELVMTRFDSSFFVLKNLDRKPKRQLLEDIKAIIFDLDDTLYPEKDFVFSGYHVVAKKVIFDYGIDIEDDLCRLFNEGRRGDLFSIVLDDHDIEFTEEYIQSLVGVYRNHTPRIRLYDDSTVLTDLKERGYKLGLITDGWKEVQKKKIESLQLTKRFGCILCSDQLGGKTILETIH